LTFFKLNYFHLHGAKPQNLMMKRAADVNSSHNKKEKKLPRSSWVKSPGNKALDGNGKLRTTKVGGGGQTAAIVSPAKSFVDAKSSSLSQSNVAGVRDLRVDDSKTNIIVIDAPKKRKTASVSRSLSLLRFRPFPLLAMLVTVGVAGCAYVVNSCALMGLSFDDSSAPSKAASVCLFCFRSFLLLFGEAMLVRVGGVVWECAAGRMFRMCVDLFSKIKAYVDFIMLELLIFCACALSHHVCVLEV
jgi:hypothetical protein